MLSRASKILTLVPKHSQSSNDEESSDSSSEVKNFNLQKRDSTESSSAPSLPSSLENLHILSDDDNNLTSCPTVSTRNQRLKPRLAVQVLAQKGDKTLYQQVNPDEKECLTVLITGSASGTIPPPTILFKYKRIPQEIAQNFPPEWGPGKTDSGWMTCEAFFEFADIFHPWLKKESIPLPIIIFVDGHASHLSLQVSQFCENNVIILIALYPKATHLLQPMDVAVFRTLKEHWKKRVHE
ncbi:unnamed protein product [Pieris brassicae]|uniref:DDE-1 domain-containing protein n=1 Tax=Pieris brassicae TaxID=7116 RepID=A0A9P0TKU3_PIEBR|nr:unnamed protein product [Pieris brassicae]